MYHIKAIYSPGENEPIEHHLIQSAVLERLNLIAGSDLAAGWNVASIDSMNGVAGPTLVILEHPAEDVCQAVVERLAFAGDQQLSLWRDKESSEFGSEHEGEQESSDLPPLALPLPFDVPSVLLTSDAKQRQRAVVRGVLTGIVLAAAMGLLTPSGSAIRQMFDPRRPSAAVPTAILCLFFWGIMHGLSRRRRFRATSRMNPPDLLPAILSGIQSHGLKGLNQALQVEAAQYNPLLRRIRVVVEQWLLRPSMQNANLVLEQQVISDQEATQRGFVLLRIFVWATPVLGLIGTVVGISIAVGGFAHFLSTDVEDISKIKEGLVGVTGGLSFAFLITLEGLLSSLILMLFTSNLQTREERYYAEIDQTIAERFLPELQRVFPERDPNATITDPEEWSKAMGKATRKVMEVINVAGEKLLAKWDERHASYVSGLKDVRATVETSAQNVSVALENATTAIGSHLARTVTAHTALLERMLEGARQGLESCNAEMNGATKTVVASLNQAGDETGTHLKSVVDALDHAASTHRTITQEAIAESLRAQSENVAGLVRASEAVNALGKLTSQVLESQAVLQLAMAQLGDSQLANLLSELDLSLKALKPLLSNFSQPFVLQAVPAARRMPNAMDGS